MGLKGTRMLHISQRLGRRVGTIATVGLAGALALGAPLSASAAATTIDFNSSTDVASYPALIAVGSGGGVQWAPWPDNDNPNAPGISGATNWNGRAGWTAHNYVVQADGANNNALWIQKAEGGCPDSGLQVASVANGQSLISSTNKVITVKAWSADASTDVQATLTDAYGGHAITKTVTNVTANQYNTLTFNFASPTTGTYISNYSYAKLSIVFDPANAKAGQGHDAWGGAVSCPATGASVSKLYKLDDISFTSVASDPAPGPDVAHKLTFENGDTLGALAYGDASNERWSGTFGGSGSGQGTPPVARTGKALELNKGVWQNVGYDNAWSGLNFVQAPTGEVITSANYKTISFDYYSPDTTNTPVQLKLIATDDSAVRKVFSAAPGWNSFSVDVSTLSGVNGVWSADKLYTKLVLYPDFADNDVALDGVTASPMTGQKYYVDNVVWNGYGLATRTGNVTLTGTAAKGSRLTASAGTFTGNTVRVSYKWYRCTVKGATVKATAPVTADRCSVISGATASTYTLATADRGKYVRASITGTTTAGAVIALTKTTTTAVR